MIPAEPPKSRRFEILREVGAGAAGRVYLARDRYAEGAEVALKVLERDSAREAFEGEFLALREIDHPGLVRVFDRGILPETGQPFYT